MFWMNVLPPLSGLEDKPSKQTKKHKATMPLHLLFDPDN
jgi:hypothetical protein